MIRLCAVVGVSANRTHGGSVLVPGNGVFEFLDSAPPAGSVFYRTTAP